VTGIRAGDIAFLKLKDIDWANGEIKILQSKTGESLALPLTLDVGSAVQDYIFNGRPQSDLDNIFLTVKAPIRAVTTGSLRGQYNVHRTVASAIMQKWVNQPNLNSLKGLRDMFIMLFLYKTGARIHELLNIRLSDVQFGKASKVLLRGKGEKNRHVPLRDNVTLHLKEYLQTFHPDADRYSDEHLFFVVRNGVKKRMTEDNVRHFVHNYGEAARKECLEAPENAHPHLFRHSCAMNLYQNGVELTLISQWLGHSNLETTLIYAHADTELKRKAIVKAVPEDSPLREHVNSERFKIDDEDTLKVLCGLK